MSAKHLVERISARVFCQKAKPGGGNPVTVFSSSIPLSLKTQQSLAQSCDWESVMVSTSSSSSSSSLTSKVNNLDFYMPSGERVSFCAHAALGAAFANTSNSNTSFFVFRSQMLDEKKEHTVQIILDEDTNEEIGTSRLELSTQYEQAPVSHIPTLSRLLRSHLGLGSEHLLSSGGKQFPSLVNASIARPKTLVYVNSIASLHNAKQPKVSENLSQRNSFASACRAVDDSTGVYLYTKIPNNNGNDENSYESWECRQFPRASGYAEDPATGIAAAALAGSLYKQGIYSNRYKFYQGTAMERPSLIEILDLNIRGKDATFKLQGCVEIDTRESIEVTDDA